MRNGFKGELEARSKSLGDAKMKLEELYATCLDEDAVKTTQSCKGRSMQLFEHVMQLLLHMLAP